MTPPEALYLHRRYVLKESFIFYIRDSELHADFVMITLLAIRRSSFSAAFEGFFSWLDLDRQCLPPPC